MTLPNSLWSTVGCPYNLRRQSYLSAILPIPHTHTHTIQAHSHIISQNRFKEMLWLSGYQTRLPRRWSRVPQYTLGFAGVEYCNTVYRTQLRKGNLPPRKTSPWLISSESVQSLLSGWCGPKSGKPPGVGRLTLALTFRPSLSNF